MNRVVDLAIIGAGPAGMSAAIEASRLGLDVLALDENPTPGGQIYRNAAANRDFPVRLNLLGPDYRQGGNLVDDFLGCGADYRPGCLVFDMAPDGTLYILSSSTGAYTLQAKRILLASGAYERPVPIPGWTLPGVMTVGAAQTMLKSSGLVPEGRVVLAGSGPLLWLGAHQLLAAGATIAAILTTTASHDYLRAASRLPAAWRSAPQLLKGLKWIKSLRRSGTRIVAGVTKLKAEGDTRFSSISYEASGRSDRLEADLLLLHEGVIPNVQATMMLGCQHVWDESQYCWKPRVDAWGNTSLERIQVAGDGAAISGAEDAELTGRLAVLEAARSLGRIDARDRDREAAGLLRKRKDNRRFRRFLDGLYRAPAFIRVPPDNDTIACRCEEVTVGAVKDALARGANTPGQVKTVVRSGMGTCQGRMCALTIASIVAKTTGRTMSDTGIYRGRPPLKPVRFDDVAGRRSD